MWECIRAHAGLYILSVKRIRRVQRFVRFHGGRVKQNKSDLNIFVVCFSFDALVSRCSLSPPRAVTIPMLECRAEGLHF